MASKKDPLGISRTTVDSSNIASLGYDEETRTMVVEFKNKTLYSYHPVQPKAFDELKNAESIGGHFNQHFRNNDRLTYQKL